MRTTKFFLPFFALAALAHSPFSGPETYHITPKPATGPSKVQFTYPGTGLDGLKVKPVNTTTFDWWYFDAVSSSLPSGDLSSIVLTFYDATAGGFEVLDKAETRLDAQISGTFRNGTPFLFDAYPSEAVVVAEGVGSEGRWGKYGSWRGSPDAKWWEVRFEDESLAIKGCVTLESVAPPHLPCGPPEAGATEEILPTIGWVNAVPDAKATVDMEIAGSELKFEGVGYHDKNWGSVPFFTAVSSWYWGHAHLGPYSIVWFDALSTSTTEYFSAYIARDGQILSSGCKKDAVVVRPWGGEDKYPPPPNSKVPDGFEVMFKDVEGNEREMKVNVTNAEVVLPAKGTYDRFIGTVEGGFVGESESWRGVAVYEEFKV